MTPRTTSPPNLTAVARRIALLPVRREIYPYQKFITSSPRPPSVITRTDTPGYDGRDHALSLSGNYSGEAWRLSTGYQENGEDFNPEVGFVSRRGFRKFDAGINNRTRPNGFLNFQELTPHANFARFWRFDGIMESSYTHLHFMGEFQDSSSTGVNYDPRSETVFEPFTVSGILIPPGRYDFSETGYSFSYNRSAPVNFGIRYNHGGFFLSLIHI